MVKVTVWHIDCCFMFKLPYKVVWSKGGAAAGHKGPVKILLGP